MKKLFATILAFIYMATSTDAAITLHYCMGKAYLVDLVAKNDKCGKCGMKKADGCCKDEVKFVKIQDKQQLTAKTSILFYSDIINSINWNPFNQHILYHNALTLISNHSPPGYINVPLIILNSVFRI